MATIAQDMPRQDRLAYLFSAGHCCIDWPFGAMYLIAPAIGSSFGWSAWEVGLLLTLQSLGAAIAYLPAGIFMDRLSERGKWLTITFFWAALGYILASYTNGYWALAAFMAFAAAGDAAWHPMATGILVKAAPTQRAKVLGIHAFGGTLSGVLAPLMAGVLLESFDWRLTTQLVLIPTVLAGCVFLFYVAGQVPKVSRDAVEPPDMKALARQWLTPFGLGLGAMMLFYNLGLIGVHAMTPIYLRDSWGFSAWEQGLAFAGALLIGALLQPGIGAWSDRVGRRSMILVALGLGFVGASLTWSAESMLLAVAGLFLVIGALDGVRSVVLASAVDLSGKSEATTLGVAFMVLDGVGAFGAVIAGYMGSEDIANAFALPMICCAVAAGATILIWRKPRPS